MPELTRRVGVPRLAGLSYPLSRPLGKPHDADGQRAVLDATLELLESAQARNASKDVPPAPIAELLVRQPWLVPRLYLGRIPGRQA